MDVAAHMVVAVKPILRLAPKRREPDKHHYAHSDKIDEAMRQQLDELIDCMSDLHHTDYCACPTCYKYSIICDILLMVFG